MEAAQKIMKRWSWDELNLWQDTALNCTFDINLSFIIIFSLRVVHLEWHYFSGEWIPKDHNCKIAFQSCLSLFMFTTTRVNVEEPLRIEIQLNLHVCKPSWYLTVGTSCKWPPLVSSLVWGWQFEIKVFFYWFNLVSNHLMHVLISIFSAYTMLLVAEPRPSDGGGGGGCVGSHPDPEIRGVPDLKKKSFSALQALFFLSFSLKKRGGSPPGPLPWIRHWLLREKLLVTT